MSFPVRELPVAEFPPLLREIPQPPKQLNYRGELPPPDLKLLAVVGSRHYTNYGKQAVEHLIRGIAGYNIGIVSGLALGIDSLAHEAALTASLYTLAIPGGGIDDSVIYPARHKPLARRILESGGGLLSEYEPTFRATTWSFPARNRLVCGIAHATLVIEAGEKSGSLITARMASDYNRELLVVPGSIFSDNSKGTHQFLKLGATPVTDANDILLALGIDPDQKVTTSKTLSASTNSPLETKVLSLLGEPLQRDELIRRLGLPVSEAATLLMQMELSGLITEQADMYYKN
ncbi:DNA-processing protein DprA [Candidatus Kaiserbacteria bacterium]|nr:DNA-processing protein DprA [Candidatus Kaiserbacteria bacterium]MCB9812030.1 DNA-protecting protein DprA [Candidatus Nomurabacteria bacterium]